MHYNSYDHNNTCLRNKNEHKRKHISQLTALTWVLVSGVATLYPLGRYVEVEVSTPHPIHMLVELFI